MKTKIFDVLRWVISPILAACLFAFCVTPAYPAKPAETKITEHAAQPPTSTSAEIAELSKQVEELKAKEREHYTLIMESERKTIDWWFNFLGVITAVLAIGGAFIPWLMGRKDRELIQQDKAGIAQDKVEIEKMQTAIAVSLSQIHQHETDAQQSAKVAKTHVDKAKENREKTDGYVSGQSISNPEELKESLAFIQQDPTADPIVRLRAEAIAASQAKQADKAYALWNALTKLAPDDASAHFNAGYWAQQLGKKLNGNELIHWMKQAGEQYKLALAIKSDLHWAANNWGSALGTEANAIAATDLAGACKLWQQAGEKFQLALSIKADMHDAASNWTTALMREATALAASNTAEATVLRNRAVQILLQHADVAPQVVGYNLACVYGVRGDVAACLKWLEICQAHNVLPDCTHLQNDTDLDNVRSAPEFVAWLQTHCPDLSSA